MSFSKRLELLKKHREYIDSLINKESILENFEIMDYEDRLKNGYSQHIITHDWLWVKPTYNNDEIWMFYGGIEACAYKIVDKKDNQILCEKVYTFNGEGDGKWSVFDIHREYANCGTPTLRIRIK
jgi:hypothetical protein